MELTDDIVNDLLTLYLAGDCSDDTKRLIERRLAADPELAKRVRNAAEPTVPLPAPPSDLQKEELAALARTKRLINRRTTFMAFAIFFTLAPFSFGVIDGQFIWLFADSPVSIAIYFSLGAVCWTAYFLTRRRITGL